jgi:hypothetical protein
MADQQGWLRVMLCRTNTTILLFSRGAWGGIGILRGGWIDTTKAIFRGTGLNFCRPWTGGCGIVAFGPGGLNGVSGARCRMLIIRLIRLLISCLFIFGRHGITLLNFYSYWSQCEGAVVA